MKEINKITLTGTNGNKVIEFGHNGKRNENQSKYFNALFNTDFTLKTDYNEIAYFGGFRCGKSFSQQLAVYLIASIYPKARILFVRDTYDQLKTSVIAQFNEEFIGLGNYTYLKTDRIAQFANGSLIYFRAFNYDTDILSAEYDLIASCQTEDIDAELFLQFFGRMSGKHLPVALLLSEGNPASGYIKERYKDPNTEELKNMGILAITDGKTSDNPFIPDGYIDRVRQNYPAWWAARYLDSEWGSIDEMVYSEFRESVHVIDPINPKTISGFKQRAGFDYGFRSNSAMNWAYVDYDGNITIYDEWFSPGKLSNEIADISIRHDIPATVTTKARRIIFIADYAIKGTIKDGRTLWDDLVRDGMLLTECSKDEIDSINLVNRLFKQGRLKITRNCTNTIKEILNWKWKKIKLGSDKNIPDETVDKDNHHCDCINYLISNLEGTETVNPAKAEYKKTLEYAVKMRTVQGIS